ncbi:hypothetical protein HaLaN_30892, partial [Haematococcus lacustris]
MACQALGPYQATQAVPQGALMDESSAPAVHLSRQPWAPGCLLRAWQRQPGQEQQPRGAPPALNHGQRRGQAGAHRTPPATEQCGPPGSYAPASHLTNPHTLHHTSRHTPGHTYSARHTTASGIPASGWQQRVVRCGGGWGRGCPWGVPVPPCLVPAPAGPGLE